MDSCLRHIHDLSTSLECIMASPKTILLTAGSGNIGRVLVLLLPPEQLPPNLVLPASSIEQFISNNLRIVKCNGPNVVLREGSIRDPIWFEELLVKHEVEAVFLCLNGIDEMFTAIQLLDAMSKVRTVKKVVYLSIMGDFLSQSGFIQAFRDRSYPHIFSKVVVEQKLMHASYPFEWTVLGPSVFFVNELRLKEVITEKGFYPEPSLEKGWSRVAVEDIALAVHNLLLDASGQWNKNKVMIGSKHRYTTTEAAKLWSKALGKSVDTQASRRAVLDQFEENVRGVTAPGLEGLARTRDIRLLYEHHVGHGYYISGTEYETQLHLHGKEPDDYGAWVEKTAASWK